MTRANFREKLHGVAARLAERTIRGLAVRPWSVPGASSVKIRSGTGEAMPEMRQRLVMERKLQEAHERYRDKVTDQAGSFPSSGSGGHGNAIAERTKMEAEEDTRLFKSVARQVEVVVI